MAAHAKRSPLITVRTLRDHGRVIEVLGWLTLLVATVVYALVPTHGGAIAALVLVVLGVVKIVIGQQWRGPVGR